MSERVIWIMAIVGAFFIGVGTGNWATREMLKTDQKYLSSTGGFCSRDGKVWWPMHKDGICYAVDEPR